MRRAASAVLLLAVAAGAMGCHHPEVTAVPLSTWNRCEPEGIPFYLPKPLLIVAKNFRHVDEPQTGQMGAAPIPDSFDHQEAYGDVKAHLSYDQPDSSGSGKGKEAGLEGSKGGGDVGSPGVDSLVPGLPSDELVAPETFYTYRIVFVPDLSQKYGLRVKGGVGEIRAAMNLVNGWMFTGLGPYYMKDSSTAQNTIAGGIGIDLAGRGVAQVIKSIADLKGVPGAKESGLDARKVAPLITQIRELKLLPQSIVMSNYAEIYVYEPTLNPDGSMSWNRIIDHAFDREVLGSVIQAQIQGDPNEVVDAIEGTPQAPAAMRPAERPASPNAEQPRPGAPKVPAAELPSRVPAGDRPSRPNQRDEDGSRGEGGVEPIGPDPAAVNSPGAPALDPFLMATAQATRRMAGETLRLGRGVQEMRQTARRESGLESARLEAETKRDLALAALGLAPPASGAAAPPLEARLQPSAAGSKRGLGGGKGLFGKFHHRRRGTLIEKRRVIGDPDSTSASDAATARAVADQVIRNGTPAAITPARVSPDDPESFRRLPP